MTDERIGNELLDALASLPRGDGGVVFRHHGYSPGERMALGEVVAARCRALGLTLAVSRDLLLAKRLGAALVHNPAEAPGTLPFSRSAHSLAQAREAMAAGAALIFLSPLFATRSHPGQEPLSRAAARQIIAECNVPVIGLGGMDSKRFEDREGDGLYGWAGIDAWLGRDQNLKAVPT